MKPAEGSSHPKTMQDTSLDELAAVSRTPSSTSSALEHLQAERARVEQYTREQYARLSRLRELIRAEKEEAARELDAKRRELDQQAAPHDARAQLEIEDLKQQLEVQRQLRERLQNERTTAQAEVQQLRDDLQRQSADAQAEVQQLRAQVRELENIKTERDDALQKFQSLQEADKGKLHGTDDWVDLDAPRGDFQIMLDQLRGQQDDIDQLRRERDEARAALQALGVQQQRDLDCFKAERDAAREYFQQIMPDVLNWKAEAESWVNLDAPRGDFQVLYQQLRSQQEEILQLRRDRDEAQVAIERMTAQQKSGLAQSKYEYLEEDWARQEEELVAERRLLMEMRRQLTEQSKELYQREMALRQKQASLELAAPPVPDPTLLEKQRELDEKQNELRLREAELREMKDMAREQIERERAEVSQERLRLARLREILIQEQQKIKALLQNPQP